MTDTIKEPYLTFNDEQYSGMQDIGINNQSILNEETLRTVFDSVTDGIAVLNQDGAFIDANRGLLGLLGYTDNERITGKTLTDFVVSDNLSGKAEDACDIKHLCPGKKYEYALVRNDGTRVPTELSVNLVNAENAVPVHYVIIIRDISEREQAQEDILIAEQGFRKSLDSSPLGVCIYSGNGDLRYANKALLDIYGYQSVEELETTPPSVRLTPHSYYEYRERLENRKLGKPVSHTYEISIIRKDGKIRHLMAFRRIIIWKGEIDYQVTFHDITKSKEAEELHHALAGNSPIGVYIVQNGRFVYVNPKMQEITGYAEEELSGMYSSDIVHPDDREVLRENATRMLKGEISDSYEFRVINRRGETRWAIESVCSIFYNGKRATLGNFMDITGRKKATEELRYSDAALHSIHEGIFTLNNQFVITRWNSICVQMFGISAEEAIGKPMWEILKCLEDYPGQNIRRLEQLVEKGFTREEQLYRSDAGNLWLDVFAQAIEDRGERWGWIIVVSDITERKRMENEIKESEQHVRSLINSMNDIVFSFDTEGRFSGYYQSYLHNYHNINLAKLVGKKYHEILPGDISEKLDQAINAIIDTGQNQQFDFSMNIHEKTQWYDTNISPVINGSGSISGFITVSRNITERKHMMELIERAAKEWEVTFNSITDAIVIIDKDFRILKANKSFTDSYSQEQQDILLEPCYEILRNHNAPCSECLLQEVLNTGQSVLKNIPQPVNGRYIQLLVSPLFDDNGNVFAFVETMRDITENKKMEDQLQQSQLLASLGTMTAGIAHEVNNPLGSILLLSEFLLKDDSSTNPRKDLKIIHSEAKRAAKIMSTLLTYSKSPAYYNRRLNLNKIIRKVLDIRQYRHKVRNITMQIELPEEPVYVKGDSSKLTQVFMNLLSNAEEATSRCSPGKIQVDVTCDNKWVRVAIADNGCGIPEENMDQVFHPFFTTKRVGDGTGLGLSTCYSIITSHNGLIHAENNDMGGATFTIELPRIKISEKKRVKKTRN